MHSLLDLKLADSIHQDRLARVAAQGQRPPRQSRAIRRSSRRRH